MRNVSRSKSIFSSIQRVLCRQYSTEIPETTAVPLTIAAYQVWGANTDVGKTLISTGLMKYAAHDGQALFLKPVQTGFPEDCDARLVAQASGLKETFGTHATELLAHKPEASSSESGRIHTEYAWTAAVSPHLAVQMEGRPVSDEEIQLLVARKLRELAAVSGRFALVETAGGPGSPGPSGRLQCDIYRPLRLPALLVGDGKLGGISTTLAAYEMLVHRGFDVAGIALMEGDAGPNTPALEDFFRNSVSGLCPVFRLPVCLPPPREQKIKSSIDDNLADWLQSSRNSLKDCLQHLMQHHQKRVEKLKRLPEDTLRYTWYPFTQHHGLTPQSLTSIDARSGEDFHVVKNDAIGLGLEPQFDGCASWWTQGVSEELQPVLVSEIMKGISRFGHVIHPQTVTEPAAELSKMLLDKVGGRWASKVFYSDDGSTAIEVALKMAFRKFWKDHPSIELHGSPDKPPCSLKVAGIDGGYHGDTLGAMDAVAPSPYNGPAQYPWYSGRGLFLKAPYVGLSKGLWRITNLAASTEEWGSLKEVLDPSRQDSELATLYAAEIDEALIRYEEDHQGRARIGACIVEPVMQGAGGMLFIDPVYQRCLIKAARERGIPVIFDEVFTGLWRLGVPSAAELLGVEPDIACFAKLLTGGVLPLAATVASQPVFDAFLGPNKLDGLLHGHSYSGHCAGTSAGRAALKIFSDPRLNPALGPDGRTLKQLWPQDLVHELSHQKSVASVVALGCVLAVELKTDDGGGYASSASAKVVAKLKADGVYARPLGSTVYLMLTPTTRPEKARILAQKLLTALLQEE